MIKVHELTVNNIYQTIIPKLLVLHNSGPLDLVVDQFFLFSLAINCKIVVDHHGDCKVAFNLAINQTINRGFDRGS